MLLAVTLFTPLLSLCNYIVLLGSGAIVPQTLGLVISRRLRLRVFLVLVLVVDPDVSIPLCVEGE